MRDEDDQFLRWLVVSMGKQGNWLVSMFVDEANARKEYEARMEDCHYLCTWLCEIKASARR